MRVYIRGMRPTLHQLIPLLALVLLTPALRADIAPVAASHFLGASVVINSELDYHEGLGYLDRSLAVAETNDAGTTVAKVNHESLINTRLIKSTTILTLRSTPGSPAAPTSSASITSRFGFDLFNTTTFELLYRTEDRSRTNNLFSLSLTNAAGDTHLQVIESRQAHSTRLVTLDAGRYFLNEASIISGIAPNTPGRSSFSTTYTFQPVPAPAPLSTLAAPALLLSRRRRNRD